MSYVFAHITSVCLFSIGVIKKNLVCTFQGPRYYSGFCVLKYFKVWNQINLTMNYICTGGILSKESDYKEKGNNCSVSINNNWLERFYSKESKIPDTCNMQTSTLTAKYREEQDAKYLNSVRYIEHFCTPKEHSLHANKARVTSLKIMTYNVLSQSLLEDHEYLYRKHSPITLKWQYRYPRLIGEITSHNPDIICLQEVEEDHLPYFNKLEDLGFIGLYKKRTGDKVDGCSIFFRNNMFSLITHSPVEYFKPGVKGLDRDNVGLVVRLFWWAGNRHVTVGNTHLLYNPKRHDVRLAQISALLSEINSLTDSGNKNDLVFLAGDLNSQPNSKVIELLTRGDLSSPEYSLDPGLMTPHNFNFKSVHDHTTIDDNEATTFQDRWVTADYIFYSSNDREMCLSSRLRLPTSKESKKVIRNLPNYASPSDHLPIVATFILAID